MTWQPCTTTTMADPGAGATDDSVDAPRRSGIGTGPVVGGAPIVVVQVISNLEFGGAQRQVIELTNHLDPEQFDVHVCSLSSYVPLGKDLVDAERRLHVIVKRFKFDVTVVPRLRRLLRSLRADIVHSYLFDADIAARLAGRWAHVRSVIGSERNTEYHLKRRQLNVYRWTRGCMDLAIANSHAGAAYNRRILGHAESQYRVVHNGVNTKRFAPRPAGPIRAALGVPDGVGLVGMFASFKEQKNHALLFRAARRVIERCPNTKFMFVGDELYAGMHGSDEYKRSMDAMVDALGLRAHSLFLGNREDVADLYCACDLTVLPSLFEGTPNVLLESMSCGVPVVATDVSDNAIIAPDGRVGFVVPLDGEGVLADRICTLLSDGALRERLGRQARAHVVAEYSAQRLAEKTAAVYREAVGVRT